MPPTDTDSDSQDSDVPPTDTDSDSQDSDAPPTDLDSDSQVSAPLEVNKDDGELATIHRNCISESMYCLSTICPCMGMHFRGK